MDAWTSGHAYEQYVGRWSRKVARTFLNWLALPGGLAWADIGCGTGALTSAILSGWQPASVNGIDASEGFVSLARQTIPDPRAHFENGDAAGLPWETAWFDAAVSGLVLNFVPEPGAMAREMARVTRPGGTVAVYVWDYAAGMEMMRHFWDAANAVNPQGARYDEGERFPLCQPAPLQTLFESTGLKSVTVRAIEIPTIFENFADYWRPFLGGTGAAPTYLASLNDEAREQIRLRLQRRLAASADGPIQLSARAWAVRGVV